MKRIICFSAFMLIATSVFSQKTTKLDLTLLGKAQTYRYEQARSLKVKKTTDASEANIQYVNVIGVLKDGATLPQTALENLGVKVGHCSYGIVKLLVPESSISELDDLDEFFSFEAPRQLELDNRISHELEHVNELQDPGQAMAEGLPQTYNGEGVVVGVFDSGIDYNHANFRDPDTKKTRIKKAMPFRNFQNGFSGHTDLEGNLVTADKIVEIYTDPSDIDTLTTDCYAQSHGTHTSGTAAGSYNGDILNKDGDVAYSGYAGTAYKADLVLSSTRTLYSDFRQVAMEEMDKYATSVGKPLVVNLSLGYNGDWLDGKTEGAILFQRLTENGTRPGRIICVSAGNDGMGKFTIYKQLDEHNDYTLRTLPYGLGNSEKRVYSSSISYFCNDTTALEVCIDTIDANTGEVYGTTCQDSLLANNQITFGYEEPHDGRFCGKVTIASSSTSVLPGDRMLALRVRSKYNKPCKVRMFQKLPLLRTNLDFRGGFDGYTEGDAGSSIGVDCCTDAVLSVGAWNSNDQWYPYLRPDSLVSSGYTTDEFPHGNIAVFSSFCNKDDNGIQRPDFAAPGMGVISGYNVCDTTFFDHDGQVLGSDKCLKWKYFVGAASEEYGRTDGRRSMFGEMQGTSMSCPNAVGVIALWLQANPDLSIRDIRDIIRHSADMDEYTAMYPQRFGAGKINALAGLKYILKYYPTAIHDVVDGEPKGLEEPSIRKIVKNGHILIQKANQMFTVSGQSIN